MRKLLVISIAAVLPLIAAGCGEKPTVTVYKQGQYQGKPDMQPWSNDQFKGSQVEWEKTIKARTQNQNENSRSVASAN
jgi:hypothetical protein